MGVPVNFVLRLAYLAWLGGWLGFAYLAWRVLPMLIIAGRHAWPHVVNHRA